MSKNEKYKESLIEPRRDSIDKYKEIIKIKENWGLDFIKQNYNGIKNEK